MSADSEDDTGDTAAEEALIRRALWWSAGVFAVLALAVAVLLIPDRPAPSVDIEELSVQRPRPAPEPTTDLELRFTDVTQVSGLDFVHENGAYGDRLLPETMGGGVAFLDFDNDGDEDVLLVNSAHWPWRKSNLRPTTRLYRGGGDGTFEDVSVAVGIDVSMYGMGVAVGDVDGDGFVDVFVTGLGENRLFRNVRGGRFEDVTEAAGVAGEVGAWSTSAAFFDYDRDGDLDLFVCNYVVWSRDIDEQVDYRLTGIGRAYGPPTDFSGTDSYLYRNDGGLVFTDVTADAGIRVAHEATAAPVGKALAVRPVDVDDDGWLDIVVANDTVRNFLFVNRRDGSFEEAGIELGVAFDTAGMATGAMGIDAAHDPDGGSLAIALGNFANEMSSFYVRRADQQSFSDDAIVAGVGAPSRAALTFGLLFVDVDLDGRLDLLAANGHVEPEIARVQTSQKYAQPPQLFRDCGPQCRKRYRLVAMANDLGRPLVGRGAAYGDIDNDGDEDLIITQVGGPPLLLRNDGPPDSHWIKLRLRAAGANTAAVGAEVVLESGDHAHRRSVMPGRSYLSQVSLPVVFGLGGVRAVDRILVRWPTGEREIWRGLEADRPHLLVQGEGEALLE